MLRSRSGEVCFELLYSVFLYLYPPPKKKTPSQTSSPVSNPNRNKYVTSLVNSTVNKALPAFAAERRDAAPRCGAVAAGRIRRCRSISLARTVLSSKPTGQTDGHLTVT